MNPKRTLFWCAACLLLGVLAADARSAGAEQQAGKLTARHRAGQTLLTFAEVESPVMQETISAVELRKARRDMDSRAKVRYRIYHSEQRIDSLEGLKPVAEVPPLSGWNADYYGVSPRPADMALRYVVEDRQAPVAPGTGICAHNPPRAGDAFYAVTRVVDGVENRAIGPSNSLQAPIREMVGQGLPVLQRIEKPERFQYVERPMLFYFVRWEAPPNCAVAGKPYDYLVGVPPNLYDHLVGVPPNSAKPAGVGIHLHCWGGSLNGGYGWWYQAEQGHLLIASNQIPYDWWTGYHERYFDGPPHEQTWKQGVVRPYSQRRLFDFVAFVTTRWKVDVAQIHVAGNSMGGSGAPMLAIRYPDRIAWATGWVGVHNPAKTPHFKGSYERVYGPQSWAVEFEDGTPVWDHFNDAWYLRKHPEKGVGLICFSNGKNDGAIGWEQAVEFYRALQDTRQPHIFVWGQSGHGQRARLPISTDDRAMPMDLRTDRSLPAFTRCSLDDKPGNGDPADGDAEGQVNLYLFWKTDDVVDRPDRWEMTVGLIASAPKDDCTVDVTPRRMQHFSPLPGQSVQWFSRALTNGKGVQSGKVTVDSQGRATLVGVRVSKGRQRLVLSR